MASTDTPIGRHLHEIVSSLSGVEYDIGMPPGKPQPVACAAGGIALACALRPPGAGEVTPEEAGVIVLKLDDCGTSVCQQDETLRGTNHFRLALHRCLQGDHLTSEGIYSPNNGLDYFSSSSAGAGEPRLKPAGGVVFTCNGRGARFHKEPNAEGQGLEAALPGVPFIGMFAGGEFGPDQDTTGGPYQSPPHSYHTEEEPHGLPRVFPLTFCSVVAMFG